MAQVLNFKAFFDKVGKAYVLHLGSLIRKQKGLDSAGYSPVSRRVHGKGKSFDRAGKRLFETGRFNQQAFTSKATEQSLSIMGNEANYDGDVTYADIIAYNDKDSPYLKGKHGSTIRRVGPNIFPWTEDLFIESYEKAFGVSLPKQIEKEAAIQIEQQVSELIPKTIKISGKL